MPKSVKICIKVWIIIPWHNWCKKGMCGYARSSCGWLDVSIHLNYRLSDKSQSPCPCGNRTFPSSVYHWCLNKIYCFIVARNGGGGGGFGDYSFVSISGWQPKYKFHVLPTCGTTDFITAYLVLQPVVLVSAKATPGCRGIFEVGKKRFELLFVYNPFCRMSFAI